MIYNITAISVILLTGRANLPATRFVVKSKSHHGDIGDGKMKSDDRCDFLSELHIPPIQNIDSIEASERKVNYWLYTRKNPKDLQNLIFGDDNSVHDSNYDGSKPLSVIVHGWLSSGDSGPNMWVTEAFLKVMDVNVIVVDWQSFALDWYSKSFKAVPKVGQNLGDFIQWLIDTAGGDWKRVHLIGHSLGAHVVGNAGRRVGGKAARLTGLDPAAPWWETSPYALRRSDARYVEVMHTDGGALGKWNPIGHADFYPDGGSPPQPGCLNTTCALNHFCSHIRAYYLFTASVQYNQLVGYRCKDLIEAENMQCHGITLNMGNGFLSKRGHGIYGLRTKIGWPYS